MSILNPLQHLVVLNGVGITVDEIISTIWSFVLLVRQYSLIYRLCRVVVSSLQLQRVELL